MFEGKTLIGVGCSHVLGELMGDYDPITCHERSWVKKLERLGNFKNSINLAEPGSSNKRSYRIIIDYLKKYNESTSNLVVIISLTQLSRYEFCYTELPPHGETNFLNIGSWMISNNDISNREEWIKRNPKRMVEFIETYYTNFHNDVNDISEINNNTLMLHTLLQALNVEHYFFEMICPPGTITQEQLGLHIPMINFKNNLGYKINAKDYLWEKGQKPEKCMHWDHAGNEFLADYMLKHIKEYYHG